MSPTLVIATADRPGVLAATLDGLVACELPGDDLHVLVADNGSDPDTKQVCGRSLSGLRVQHLPVARRGKTIAQNAAVAATDADLLVFTDDDVTFDPGWLRELVSAAERWPDYGLFGGRVVPLWPDGVPARLDGSRYVSPLYTLLDLGDAEGPRADFRPFGPNMAIRRSVFEAGIRFDEQIGPGSAIGVSMGDETGIARQLEARGESAVYVPSSLVYHRVTPQQLSLRWQLERGVRYGRMLAYYGGPAAGPELLGVPRWIYRQVASSALAAAGHALSGRRRAAFDRLMDAVVAVGQGQARRALS